MPKATDSKVKHVAPPVVHAAPAPAVKPVNAPAKIVPDPVGQDVAAIAQMLADLRNMPGPVSVDYLAQFDRIQAAVKVLLAKVSAK